MAFMEGSPCASSSWQVPVIAAFMLGAVLEEAGSLLQRSTLLCMFKDWVNRCVLHPGTEGWVSAAFRGWEMPFFVPFYFRLLVSCAM